MRYQHKSGSTKRKGKQRREANEAKRGRKTVFELGWTLGRQSRGRVTLQTRLNRTHKAMCSREELFLCRLHRLHLVLMPVKSIPDWNTTSRKILNIVELFMKETISQSEVLAAVMTGPCHPSSSRQIERVTLFRTTNMEKQSRFPFLRDSKQIEK